MTLLCSSAVDLKKSSSLQGAPLLDIHKDVGAPLCRTYRNVLPVNIDCTKAASAARSYPQLPMMPNTCISASSLLSVSGRHRARNQMF